MESGKIKRRQSFDLMSGLLTPWRWVMHLLRNHWEISSSNMHPTRLWQRNSQEATVIRWSAAAANAWDISHCHRRNQATGSSRRLLIAGEVAGHIIFTPLMNSSTSSCASTDVLDPGCSDNVISCLQVCKLRTTLSSYELFGDAKGLPRFRLLAARPLSACHTRWKCVMSDGQRRCMSALAISGVSRLLDGGLVRVGDMMELVAFRMETLRRGDRICVLLRVRLVDRWRRCARSVYDIDWESYGFHSGYRESMKRYIYNLNETVKALRMNDNLGGGHIHLGVRPFDINFDNNDKPRTVLHLNAEVIRPHWDALIDALAGHALDGVVVTVIGVVVPSCLINSLSLVLAGKPISGVVMRRAMLGSARGTLTCPFRYLLSIVRRCMALRFVKYDGYYLSDPPAVRSLVTTLRRHPSMREISLRKCFPHHITSAGHCELTKWVHHLRVLDRIALDNNGLGKEAASALADFIASNPPLESLSLRGNLLDDRDASTIIGALCTNTNLRTMDLTGNILTLAGCDGASSIATYDDRSFRLMYESNHSCHLILGLRLSVLRNNDPLLTRGGRVKWSKLHSVLSNRNQSSSNVAALVNEFGENYLIYLPFIFGKIIRLGGMFSETHLATTDAIVSDPLVQRLRTPSLSIVYELVRGSFGSYANVSHTRMSVARNNRQLLAN